MTMSHTFWYTRLLVVTALARVNTPTGCSILLTFELQDASQCNE